MKDPDLWQTAPDGPNNYGSGTTTLLSRRNFLLWCFLMIIVYKWNLIRSISKRAGYFDHYHRTWIIQDHTCFSVVGMAQTTVQPQLVNNTIRYPPEKSVRGEREVGWWVGKETVHVSLLILVQIITACPRLFFYIYSSRSPRLPMKLEENWDYFLYFWQLDSL